MDILTFTICYHCITHLSLHAVCQVLIKPVAVKHLTGSVNRSNRCNNKHMYRIKNRQKGFKCDFYTIKKCKQLVCVISMINKTNSVFICVYL